MIKYECMILRQNLQTRGKGQETLHNLYNLVPFLKVMYTFVLSVLH
jgi:hypothetical protein